MCVSCHGPTGKPPDAMVVRLGVRDLTDPTVRTRLTVAHVEAQVADRLGEQADASFTGAMTDEQIKAVAAFVASDRFVRR